MFNSSKNVVVIGVGSIASKIAAKVRENADSYKSLALSFIVVSLDMDAGKVGGLKPDKKDFLSSAPFFETWWNEEIKGLPGVGRQLIKKADYVLILATGQDLCCKAASKLKEQLKKRDILSTILTTRYFGLNSFFLASWNSVEVKSRVYKRMAMDQMKDFYKRFRQDESTNKKRIELEEWKWLSLVEGALNVICFTDGCPEGSNLFEEIFSKDGPSWFCSGRVSGEGRAGMVIDQVVLALINDNVFMSKCCKAFLCLKADDLSEEELQILKAEISQNFVPSQFFVSVTKTNNSEGVLNFSLFYG